MPARSGQTEPIPADSARQAARGAGLRHVSDAMPGITRQTARERFRYVAADGKVVRDAATLERIRTLAVPPAWVDVWICPHPEGHLQATGRDARRRKQYRYHPDWVRARGEDKHARICDFGAALPRLRRRLRKALRNSGLPQEKVVAMVVAVMAATLIRIGNPQYARSNRSFGLTTLRNRHVKAVGSSRLRFRFPGKSGQAQDVLLDDRKLSGLVRRCQQLPGQHLFQYEDEDGTVQPVDSADINAWLQAAMDGTFTAKDFRTWGGTLMAFRQLAATPLPQGVDGGPPSERALSLEESRVVAEVAAALGNTSAVCRKAYIDPVLFAAWRAGRLHGRARGAVGERQWEAALLRLLRAEHRRARQPKPA